MAFHQGALKNIERNRNETPKNYSTFKTYTQSTNKTDDSGMYGIMAIKGGGKRALRMEEGREEGKEGES